MYTGSSVKFWLEQFDALKLATGPMWGFDSFEGLPEEAAGVGRRAAERVEAAGAPAAQYPRT